MPTENWKTIDGFENYEISDYGRVRSLTHTVTSCTGQTYTVAGEMLKPRRAGKGYVKVALCEHGKVHDAYVHELVAKAFLCADANGEKLIVNHIDGNKRNNNASNLEWTTYSGNNQHAYDMGLKLKGEGYYNAKLTESAVADIRTNYSTVQNLNYFAKKYHVSRATVKDVVASKTWKSLES